MQQQIKTTTRRDERITAQLREDYALLSRLKHLRGQGQQNEARELARYLELLDQADDWSMRYSS
jgi:hypothetical protein